MPLSDETTTEEAQRKVFFDKSQIKEYLRAAKELKKSGQAAHEKRELGPDALQVKTERGIASGVNRIGSVVGLIPYVGAVLKIPFLAGSLVLKGFAWLDDKRIRRGARQEEEEKYKRAAQFERLAGKKHVQEKPPAHPGIIAQIPVLSAILGQEPNPTLPFLGTRLNPRLYGILRVFALALSLFIIFFAIMITLAVMDKFPA